MTTSPLKRERFASEVVDDVLDGAEEVEVALAVESALVEVEVVVFVPFRRMALR